MSLAIDPSLDYLGPEMKEEVAAAAEKWLQSLHLLMALTPDRFRLTRVDLHILIDGKFEARIIKPVDRF